MLELPSEQKTWSESTICVIIFLGREFTQSSKILGTERDGSEK